MSISSRAYAGALLAVSLLAGCGSGANAGSGATATAAANPSSPAPATRSGAPACAQKAIQEGAQRAVAAYGATIADVHGFQCSGGIAYAFADEKDQQGNVNSVTLLFKASGTLWTPVDRGKYCQNGYVPKAIYVNACETQ